MIKQGTAMIQIKINPFNQISIFQCSKRVSPVKEMRTTVFQEHLVKQMFVNAELATQNKLIKLAVSTFKRDVQTSKRPCVCVCVRGVRLHAHLCVCMREHL